MPFKIILPCLLVFRLADINKSGMYKVFYYAIMTKIFIIKSSSDIDNKELFPLSSSSYFEVCISSNIDTDYPKIID